MQIIIRAIFCSAFMITTAIVAAQKIGFDFNDGQQKISMPVEIYNNLIIIPVTVADSRQLNFILDTGVKNTILINKKLADSLGANYTRTVQLLGAGNDRLVDALVMDPVNISLPGITGSAISILVLEQDFLELEHHLGVKVHGLIGYDLFSRFVVKVDYFHEKITVYEPGAYRVKKSYHAIDLEVVDGKPIAQLNLHFNHDTKLIGKLLIDTGASHALVLKQDSDAKIILPEKNIKASLGRGLSGEITGNLARIDAIKFGKKELREVIASFPQTDDLKGLKAPDRHGSIGGELLKKFTVVFDFLNEKMYVKANRLYKYPFEYNMSGLEFTAQGKDLNLFVISNIRHQSAADNIGFKKGDILSSLNNIPSDKLDMTDIYTKLNLREGKKVNLTVYRDGKYISRSFRLKREI